MDTFGLEEEKQKEKNSRRLRFVLIIVVVAAVLVVGICGFIYGFDVPEAFLSKTAALTLNTFRDVLGSGGGGKLAFEIDMSGEPQSSSPLSAISETASSGAVQDYASGEMVSVSQILNASGEKSAALGGSNGESSSASSLGAGFGSDSAPSDATAKTSSGKSAKNSSAPATSLCGFASAGSPARKVIFNEIAWMGSAPQAGETAAHAANREWIELKNISRDDIYLTGWQISDSSGKFKVIFGAGDKIGTGGSVTFNAGGFYLLERASDNSVPGIKANEIYSGVLTNSGMSLRLFGADCTLSDEIVNASSGWAAGDNPTKATMERNAHDFGWHTSVSPGGTPKAENSVPAVVASATTTASTSTITAATTTAVTVTTTTVSAATTTPISSIVSYTVGVSSQGDGSGMVISSPVGIYCGTDCVESYISGTLLTLAAMPDSNSEFAGWSGPCSGTGVCVFAVNGTTAVVGMFKSLAPSSPTASQSSGDD